MNQPVVIGVIVVGILVLSLLSFGAYELFYAKPNTVSTSTVENGSVSLPIGGRATDTTTWQTYSNDQYGFELRYPSFISFAYQPQQKGNSFWIGWKTGKQSGSSMGDLITIIIDPKTIPRFNVPREDFLKEANIVDESSLNVKRSAERRIDFVVDGAEAHKFIFNLSDVDLGYLYQTYIFKGDVVFDVSAWGVENGAIADQILSTFSFTGLDTTTNGSNQVLSGGTGSGGVSGGSGIVEVPPIISSPTLEETLSPDAVPPSGFVRSQLSVYYQKVRIGGVQMARAVGDVSSFSLYADGILVKPVDVTNWVLKTNRGLITMPRAIKYYGPFGGTENNLVLAPGEYVNVWSNTDPLGKNFQVNRCMGFLNSVYDFVPPIGEQCPEMYNRDELITLSGECQDFILQFGGCRVPTSDERNASVVLNDATCRSFLDRFNYNACYSRYNSASDFLTTEWRVYLGRDIPFDPLHDRVLLFDSKGLLADYYVY